MTTNDDSLIYRDLLDAAQEAREAAYAPFSSFKVGAALKTATGAIYTGCNIENASYALAICAERTAVFKAICDRQHGFVALAVVTDTQTLATPCGSCRQVLAEFADDLVVVVGNLHGDLHKYTLLELFPSPFRMKPK